MGKSAPKAPPAPDPVATAAAQTASNKETAYWNAVLNNVNQFTPYGNITYQQEGDGVYNPDKPPQFTSTITLSPEQQAIYDTMVSQDRQLLDLGGQQISRIQESVNQPYSFDGIGNEVREADVLQAQKNAEEAIMSRLTPQFGRDEEAMRTRLINQGITQGSEAYDREMERFGQTKNDARIQALLAANQYGGDLQNQTLQRRNQGIQEYTTQRTAPLNEYIGFTSGTQVQNPQFQNISYGGAAPVDYAGLVNNKYQADMANYNARVAGRNSFTQGLFGLGGVALNAALSDIRAKKNIKPYGVENGFNVYEFEYLDSDKKYIGVMAHEVEAINPDAVVTTDNGMKAVNYDMIGVEFREVA